MSELTDRPVALDIMDITDLPAELVFRVTDTLRPEDVYNLSLTTKRFAYLIRFTGLCKRVLMVSSPSLRSSISQRQCRHLADH